MVSITLSTVLLFAFSFIVTATNVNSTNLDNAPTTSVGVVQPQDIGVQRLFRGRPLPQPITVYTLYYAKLALYRRTVRRHGDAILGSMDFDLNQEPNLRLEIRSFEQEGKRNFMTIGTSFYSVSSMIKTMLNPENPADGFWELRWRVFNRALVPGSEVPMGYLNLLLGNAETSHNDNSTNLSAPFPVPETDVTLLIGPRGADLVQGNVVLIMDDLMSTAWQSVARSHSVQTVSGQIWNRLSRYGVSVTLRPRMHGGTSMVTDTDLAEAAFGLAYYFITQKPAFEVTITIVRPNERGRRIPIGEFEISNRLPRVEIGGSGDDAPADTS